MSQESISVFDIFKIGIGPSSSHTLGPWRAALQFLSFLKEKNLLQDVTGIEILFYGSLAKTGIGHGTDIAVQLGLSGEDPVTFEVSSLGAKIEDIKNMKKLVLAGIHEINFEPNDDIEFLYSESLPFHPNALTFLATLKNEANLSKTYYSIGGGFIVEEGANDTGNSKTILPFPIDKAEDLLHWCIKTGMNIHEIVLENEITWYGEAEVKSKLLNIWDIMKSSIYRGCHTNGYLPGGLNVSRRAFDLNRKLLANNKYTNYDEWAQQIKLTGNSFNNILLCFMFPLNQLAFIRNSRKQIMMNIVILYNFICFTIIFVINIIIWHVKILMF